MAEWKKIIVSGSGAAFASITASNAAPIKLIRPTGSHSTIPLVLDSNGNVATGSAYAVQGGSDFVAQSGSFVENIVIVGAGTNAVKSAIEAIDVNFASSSIINVEDITAHGDISSSADVTANRVIIDADSGKGLVFKQHDNGDLTNNRIALTDAENIQIRAGGAVQMVAGTDVQFIQNGKAQFNDGANQSRFKIFNKSANTGSGGTENNALLAIQNTSDSDMMVLHGDGRTGIGGGPHSSAMLLVHGDISGSGGISLKNLHNANGDLTNFNKTVVYDVDTGQLGFDATSNVGGVTSVAGGTNINTSGTGTVTVNLNSSVANLSNLEVNGRISGSGIALEGSASAGTLLRDGSKVNVQHVTASNLLVQESSIFNGSFLFNGIDFTVQNASTFSGSNAFGSGSDPANTFHEFTGSVSISGSNFTVTADVDFNNDVNIDGDLTVGGYTDLDHVGIANNLHVSGSVTLGDASGDTLTVGATTTFSEDVTLDTANLNVGGNITGSELRLTGLGTAANLTDTRLLVISGSGDNVFEASLSTLTLDDISTTAGPGITIDGQIISVDSSSMDNHFRSASLANIDGDVKFTNDNDNTFTSVIQSGSVTAPMVEFVGDDAHSPSGGDLLVGSGSQYHKRSISGVISISETGVTSFSSEANIDVANQVSSSFINTAPSGAFSLVLVPSTGGPATSSLYVDGVTSDFNYDTGTNTLSIGTNGSVSTFGKDVSIAGNLTVAGTTTTLSTQELLIEDNFIGLNSNYLSGGDQQSSAPTNDAGIQVGRGTSDDAVLVWSEAYDRWMIGLENLTNNATDFTEGDVLDENTVSAFIVTMDIETVTPNAASLPNFGASTYRRGQMRIDAGGDIWMYVD